MMDFSPRRLLGCVSVCLCVCVCVDRIGRLDKGLVDVDRLPSWTQSLVRQDTTSDQGKSGGMRREEGEVDGKLLTVEWGE
ncbi:hypothetical protein BO86DRAFT_392355 [Aspergillus japonicus CBS 114.51]|uniref:Secreted protein n=1 Tax=Aspergillus japonicus CBS 114.51 TaxID=1448312 RepID=A0A8T8WQ09_ASPJA|nr:hypothetical protein BO86DRAFT_392355 [Aspergillus japonicus CBS 114.51]RAH77682.1 hypothetical protein BO86DRAFT_392355 [Aspergillus japonicus CBS 114.51]